MNQHKTLKHKVKHMEKELTAKTKEVERLKEEVKELKTQMFTYQRVIRDEK